MRTQLKKDRTMAAQSFIKEIQQVIKYTEPKEKYAITKIITIPKLYSLDIKTFASFQPPTILGLNESMKAKVNELFELRGLLEVETNLLRSYEYAMNLNNLQAHVELEELNKEIKQANGVFATHLLKKCNFVLTSISEEYKANKENGNEVKDYFDILVTLYRGYQIASFYLNGNIGCLANAQHVIACLSQNNQKLCEKLLLGSAVMYDRIGMQANKIAEIKNYLNVYTSEQKGKVEYPKKFPTPIILVKSVELKGDDVFDEIPNAKTYEMVKRCNETLKRIKEEWYGDVNKSKCTIEMMKNKSNLERWQNFILSAGKVEDEEFVNVLQKIGVISMKLSSLQKIIERLPQYLQMGRGGNPGVVTRYNGYLKRWERLSHTGKIYTNRKNYQSEEKYTAIFGQLELIDENYKKVDDLCKFESVIEAEQVKGDAESYIAEEMAKIQIRTQEINELLYQNENVMKNVINTIQEYISTNKQKIADWSKLATDMIICMEDATPLENEVTAFQKEVESIQLGYLNSVMIQSSNPIQPNNNNVMLQSYQPNNTYMQLQQNRSNQYRQQQQQQLPYQLYRDMTTSTPMWNQRTNQPPPQQPQQYNYYQPQQPLQQPSYQLPYNVPNQRMQPVQQTPQMNQYSYMPGQSYRQPPPLPKKQNAYYVQMTQPIPPSVPDNVVLPKKTQDDSSAKEKKGNNNTLMTQSMYYPKAFD